MKNLVFLGPPGSGKGTQATRIAKEFGLSHISTGDMLRASNDDAVKKIINAGKFLPSEMITEMVEKELPKHLNGWILDGYPRTEEQALALDRMAKDGYIAIYLNIPDEEIIKRLSGRLFCPNCNSTFHQESKVPKERGICDNCGTKLTTRKDDTPEVIKERLSLYHSKTHPIIDYFKRNETLAQIDGKMLPPDETFSQILSILKRL